MNHHSLIEERLLPLCDVWWDGIPVHDGSWPEAVFVYVHKCTDWDNVLALMVPGGLLLDYDMVWHWQSYLSSYGLVEDIQSLDFASES